MPDNSKETDQIQRGGLMLGGAGPLGHHQEGICLQENTELRVTHAREHVEVGTQKENTTYNMLL